MVARWPLNGNGSFTSTYQLATSSRTRFVGRSQAQVRPAPRMGGGRSAQEEGGTSGVRPLLRCQAEVGRAPALMSWRPASRRAKADGGIAAMPRPIRWRRDTASRTMSPSLRSGGTRTRSPGENTGCVKCFGTTDHTVRGERRTAPLRAPSYRAACCLRCSSSPPRCVLPPLPPARHFRTTAPTSRSRPSSRVGA